MANSFSVWITTSRRRRDSSTSVTQASKLPVVVKLWVSAPGSASLSLSERAGESLNESLPVPARFSSRLDTHGDLSIPTISGSSRARRLPNHPRPVNSAKSKLIVNPLPEFRTLTVLCRPRQACAPVADRDRYVQVFGVRDVRSRSRVCARFRTDLWPGAARRASGLRCRWSGEARPADRRPLREGSVRGPPLHAAGALPLVGAGSHGR